MIDHYWREILGVLITMWLGTLTFFGKRALNELDNKAEKEDFRELLRRMDDHIQDDKEMRRELSRSINSLTAAIDHTKESIASTKESVARIEGQLKQ